MTQNVGSPAIIRPGVLSLVFKALFVSCFQGRFLANLFEQFENIDSYRGVIEVQ